MPPTRGWAALGAGFAFLILWIAFGEQLLLATAALLVLGTLIGAATVRRSAPSVEVDRTITPVQIHDGDAAVVELELQSFRRSTNVLVTDSVGSLGSAVFLADRLVAGEPMTARYEVDCRPRGIYTVGPAHIKVQDLLGLAERGRTMGSTSRLVVYPIVDILTGLPIIRGQDPNQNVARSNHSPVGGDDFFTLRHYQQGDDLRRVHWPSSARQDDLMIKQLEMPWQSRAFVALDPRSSAYSSPAAFEHAVRGAASAVAHLHKSGFAPTVWLGGIRATHVNGHGAYSKVLEELAGIEMNRNINLPAAFSKVRNTGVRGGVLVLVTGTPDNDLLGVHRLLSRDYRSAVVMASTTQVTDAADRLSSAGAVYMQSHEGESWTVPWRQGMERTWSTATVR
ncbi:MAG TPA: DUF58 domain-containing protein [Actinobacteria bacterium]|nr:DUF58 domain-containing protein [Actinomycetota bacterium]